MSNTAYQRASADMTAAGINPILAHNPAGFGGGAQANLVAPELDIGGVGEAVNRSKESELAQYAQEENISKMASENTAIKESKNLTQEKIKTEKITQKIIAAEAATAQANLPAQLKEAQIRLDMVYPDAILNRAGKVLHGTGSAQQIYQNSRPPRPTSTSETTEYYNNKGEVRGGTIKSKTTRTQK